MRHWQVRDLGLRSYPSFMDSPLVASQNEQGIFWSVNVLFPSSTLEIGDFFKSQSLNNKIHDLCHAAAAWSCYGCSRKRRNRGRAAPEGLHCSLRPPTVKSSDLKFCIGGQSLSRGVFDKRAGVRVLSYSNWLITFLPTNEKPSSFSLSTNDKPPYIQW